VGKCWNSLDHQERTRGGKPTKKKDTKENTGEKNKPWLKEANTYAKKEGRPREPGKGKKREFGMLAAKMTRL